MRCSDKTKYQVFSFFSGLGFLDLGFSKAGFDIAFVNEYNEHFLQAYKYARESQPQKPSYGYCHDSAEAFLDDLFWRRCFPDLPLKKLDNIGFIGGPPCPDFSSAGKNAGCCGENGILTTIYFKIIRKRQPSFFVFENVKGLYKTEKHHTYYETQKGLLKKSGYTLFDSVENALCYGVPQYRDRLILIGFRKKCFLKNLTFNFQKNKTYCLDEICNRSWPLTSPFIEDGVLPRPNGIVPELTVEYWFKKNAVNTHPNAEDFFKPKKLERFETIAEGDSAGKSFKRLHRWRYSPTAAYGNNEVHLHPYKKRRISVSEALAIQSLPRDFVVLKELSLSEKFKMVANGVPFLLAQTIANNLHQCIDEYKIDQRGNNV